MKNLILCLALLLGELAISYFAERRTVATVSRQKWRATLYDTISQGLGFVVIVLIVVNRSYVPFILSAIAGSAVGTFLVAGRK